jgi:H+/gluconate symporter-like permease
LDDLLGLVYLAGYIVAIIALAAGITWAVIKIFPTQRSPKKDEKDEKPAKADANGSGEGQGRLFRRSKRGSS